MAGEAEKIAINHGIVRECQVLLVKLPESECPARRGKLTSLRGEQESPYFANLAYSLRRSA
jgi:hypothetical protein